MTIQFDSRLFALVSIIFAHLFQGALIELLFSKIRIQNSLMCVFWLMSKDRSSPCAILCCLVKMLSFNLPLRISK